MNYLDIVPNTSRSLFVEAHGDDDINNVAARAANNDGIRSLAVSALKHIHDEF